MVVRWPVGKGERVVRWQYGKDGSLVRWKKEEGPVFSRVEDAG